MLIDPEGEESNEWAVCPETYPEVTTLKNILVISGDDGIVKLWSRMTCKEMETTFFQKSIIC